MNRAADIDLGAMIQKFPQQGVIALQCGPVHGAPPIIVKGVYRGWLDAEGIVNIDRTAPQNRVKDQAGPQLGFFVQLDDFLQRPSAVVIEKAPVSHEIFLSL